MQKDVSIAASYPFTGDGILARHQSVDICLLWILSTVTCLRTINHPKCIILFWEGRVYFFGRQTWVNSNHYCSNLLKFGSVLQVSPEPSFQLRCFYRFQFSCGFMCFFVVLSIILSSFFSHMVHVRPSNEQHMACPSYPRVPGFVRLCQILSFQSSPFPSSLCASPSEPAYLQESTPSIPATPHGVSWTTAPTTAAVVESQAQQIRGRAFAGRD